MLNEVSLSVVTFCPLSMMGLLQSCLEEEGEREREDCVVCLLVRGGGGVDCIAQHNSIWGGDEGGGGKEAGGFTFAVFSPCFTSQLCLDKPHSTCVITTDTVTFSRHKFRPRLGD